MSIGVCSRSLYHARQVSEAAYVSRMEQIRGSAEPGHSTPEKLGVFELSIGSADDWWSAMCAPNDHSAEFTNTFKSSNDSPCTCVLSDGEMTVGSKANGA